MQDWRRFPYLDPDLPAAYLPPPGQRSRPSPARPDPVLRRHPALRLVPPRARRDLDPSGRLDGRVVRRGPDRRGHAVPAPGPLGRRHPRLTRLRTRRRTVRGGLVRGCRAGIRRHKRQRRNGIRREFDQQTRADEASPRKLSPHDAFPSVIYLGSPSVRSGQGMDDVESMGPVAGVAGAPRAARVLDLDPDLSGGRVTADREGVPGGAAVQDGVGGEFARDQDYVVGGGAASALGHRDQINRGAWPGRALDQHLPYG